MGLLQSYTLSELEAESGFDKRTIAYYISEGLLPKVGRRGPRTRYPQDFLERLVFIRRVRDLQDSGQLRAVTLTEIRAVMDTLTPDEIRRGARRGGSVEWIRERFEDPDWDTSELAVPAEQVAAAMPMAEVELGAWDDERSGDPAVASRPQSFQMLSASRRRDALTEQMASREPGEDRSLAMQAQQPSMEPSHALREQQVRELMDSIRRLDERMERMSGTLREELRCEMREMKELILGMHERLRDVEERLKPEPEPEAEADPEAGGQEPDSGAG